MSSDSSPLAVQSNLETLSMEESQIYQNVADDHDRDRSPGVGDDLIEFSSFNCKKNVTSLGLYELVKLSIAKGLAGGADKVFKDQKPIKFKNRPSSSLRDNNKNFGICRVCCNECDNVSEQSVLSSVESSEDRFDDLMSKPSSKPGSYDGSALNFVAFLAILLTKSVGFQFSVMLSILTLPIWLSYCSFMFLMFPFQTLIRIRGFLMKMLWRMWSGSCSSVTSFVGDRLNVPNSPVKLGMRLGRALFMSIYVCSVLFGLLVLGFVIGSFAMRQIAEEPIQTTETLHFDYTKSSPVAFVPVLSSSGDAVPFEQSGKPVRARFIPHNRKFQLTLSLTLPESDYNRKLGVFQVCFFSNPFSILFSLIDYVSIAMTTVLLVLMFCFTYLETHLEFYTLVA